MSKKEVKTNAMRMLDRAKVSYSYEEYECDDFTDGIQTADKLGYDHKLVYKTLVTTGKTGNHYVFVIPIEAEIDFKKAAKVVGEKSLEMLHLKDLTKVTGYVRGGCTAIGMKKQFPTVIQEDAKELEYMHVSGGKLGMQIRLQILLTSGCKIQIESIVQCRHFIDHRLDIDFFFTSLGLFQHHDLRLRHECLHLSFPAFREHADLFCMPERLRKCYFIICGSNDRHTAGFLIR